MDATLVASVVTAESLRLADGLRREAIEATVTVADVLREPAQLRVYVFFCDASVAIALASTIVEWGAGRAGLVGVLSDGGGEPREVLLSAGFDDAVTGPIGARELSARIRSVHRRLFAGRIRGDRIRHGPFSLDLLHRTLWTEGRSITLTATELEVMRALMLAGGRPLSRADLLDAVWGPGEDGVTDRAVDNVILRLRKKLPQEDAIENVRGVGFRLKRP